MAATPGVGATYKAREVEEGYGSIKQLVISTASIISMGVSFPISMAAGRASI
jgi:hypothetical protein